MQKKIALRLHPSQSVSDSLICEQIAEAEGISASAVSGFNIIKKSLDARGRKVWVMLTVNAFINEPYQQRPMDEFHFGRVDRAPKKVVIIGAGPAGLFAALRLIEKGIQPVILERGKEVRARRRDLAVLNKQGIINPESNYCFGEGGAGTYSDGKLYTRSSKRGDINRILNLFVHFGAGDHILYDAHPHIGTNKLPHIISAISNTIRECGGMVLFEKKVIDFISEKNIIKSVKIADGSVFEADAFILATGHSARDIYVLLDQKKISIELKPFALGIRIEHPQQLIDQIQYHTFSGTEFSSAEPHHLPPASYSLVTQVNQRGVFSFCMCPGGIIAPAATTPETLVVNGWSPSKRNNPYANSGIVVSVQEKDVQLFKKHGALAAMYFQESVERKAYTAGGGKFVAPAQRMDDFIENRSSSTLPPCSYLPGVNAVSLKEVLPEFVYNSLREGLKDFGKKMKGYRSNEAIVVATESRTSSPVRIPRDKEKLHHPQIENLYPCAEGAGYAGGIVSAAMDGENIASILSEKFQM